MSPLAYIKLGGALLAGIALALFLWWAYGIYEKARKLPIVEQERDQAIADLNQYRSDLREAQEASNGYQSELSHLRIAAARAGSPVVRVCKQPRVPEHREVPAAGPGPVAAAPATGDVPPRDELPGGAGRDIGPGLFGLADRADELSAQVRGLQAYALACSGVR